MSSDVRQVVWGAGKVMAATTAFAVLHSLLASRAAKNAAERALGRTKRNALYRPFYLVQSVVTFGALLVYFRRQPEVKLYEIRGPGAWLMRIGQVAGLGHAFWAAHHVGIPGMLGLSGLLSWARGDAVPAEPEAQGPARENAERMKASGPFRWQRHPLNFAPLPVLWLFPRMTSRLAALNVASTVYLIAGSVHEEARLRRAHPSAYARYQQSGVPFYLPKPPLSRPAAPPPDPSSLPATPG
jgi:protein-S-isoprenylcysteine O-methyltransferase Ste14